MLEEYLGIRPPPDAFKGNTLKLRWLVDSCGGLPDGANEEQIYQRVRAYLLYLIGVVLFPDKSGNRVQLVYFPLLIDLSRLDEYSWGSAVLACLYRNLCVACRKDAIEIAGCLPLLQLWSWERISIGRPTTIRSQVTEESGVEYPIGSQMRTGVDPLGCKWFRVDRKYTDHLVGLVPLRHAFDSMTEEMFKWQPYTCDVLAHLPPIYSEDPIEWIVVTPLICFETVEWHLPNRVVRQFGWHPYIPPVCNTDLFLHIVDRRCKSSDYAELHKDKIEMWVNRKSSLTLQGIPYKGYIDYNDEYLQWYRRISRAIISPQSIIVPQGYQNQHYFYPTAADYALLTQANVFNYNHSSTMLRNMSDDVPLSHVRMIQEMQAMSLQSLQNTRQGHLVQIDDEQPSSPPSHQPPRYDFRHLENRHMLTPVQEEDTPSSSNLASGSSSQRPKRGRASRRR